MKILKYVDFLIIRESNQYMNVGIIGDSGVPLYKHFIPELRTFGEGDESKELHHVGWSSTKLAKAVMRYKDVHPEIKLLFIKIGDNDVYKTGSELYSNIDTLSGELPRIFPQAKFVVIKGGWGWGGLDKFTGKEDPMELSEYYKIWKNKGFEVMELSQGYSKDHHGISTPRIKEQSDMMKKIIDSYSQGQEISQDILDDNDSKKDLDKFYGILQNSIDEGVILEQQGPGNYSYSLVVELVQIGLEFLGFDLPRFGADGLYGPETAESIRGFKQSRGIEGTSDTFNASDLIELMKVLKENNFDQSNLDVTLQKSAELSFGGLSEFGTLEGDMEFLYYLPHQQGPTGAAYLVLAYLGLSEIYSATKANNAKYLRGNCHDDAISEQILMAINAGNDQRAAALFLGYQKDLFNKKKVEHVRAVNDPKNKYVVDLIDSTNSKLPKEFLYTVCYLESGFNPDSNKNSGSSYKGLFQMDIDDFPNKAKKIFPNDVPNIYDPKQNVFVGVRNLEEGFEFFRKIVGDSNLSKMGISTQISTS